MRKLARAHGVSTESIYVALHKDLNLSKESVRWGHKTAERRDEEGSNEDNEVFLAIVPCHSLSMLDIIVTMEESVVLFHTADTKQQSNQWFGKC